MGRGESKAGAAKQGREEAREGLGEAQQLGAGKSELEPEDPNVCAPSLTPAHPPPSTGSMPPSQAELLKAPLRPMVSQP